MKNILRMAIYSIVALGAGFIAIFAIDHYGLLKNKPLDTVEPVTTPAVQVENRIADAAFIKKDREDEVPRIYREPSPTCSTSFSIVQLESPEVARRAGFKVEQIQTLRIDETISCNAEVVFNGNRYAHLSSRVSGTISQVLVDLGDKVATNDVLAIIESSELSAAKAAYLQAQTLVDLWKKNFSREQALFAKGIGIEKEVIETETKLVESQIQYSKAQQQLQSLGLSNDDLTQIITDKDTSSFLPLRAPFTGTVVQLDAVLGEVISISDSLIAITDTRTMWVMLDIYESDVTRVNKEQIVSFVVDAMPNHEFTGTIVWISSEVHRKTRTIQARAVIDNPKGLLRANMFGSADVHVRTIEDAILVPQTAVQWDGCCNVVFVRHSDTVYQPYKITLAFKHGEYYVVEDGLPPGEFVVTQGSFLLKTEILKGNIGAGCCEIDPGASE